MDAEREICGEPTTRFRPATELLVFLQQHSGVKREDL